MESPVTDELAGATNALIIGVLIAAVGLSVLCWVGGLILKSAYRAIRRRILSAMNTDSTGSP